MIDYVNKLNNDKPYNYNKPYNFNKPYDSKLNNYLSLKILKTQNNIIIDNNDT